MCSVIFKEEQRGHVCGGERIRLSAAHCPQHQRRCPDVPRTAIASEALQSQEERNLNPPELTAHSEVQLSVSAPASIILRSGDFILCHEGSAARENPGGGDASVPASSKRTLLATRTISAEQSAAPEQSHLICGDCLTRFLNRNLHGESRFGARVEEWMSKTGVQGVSIGSSANSPGEAALVIFLIRGVKHSADPASD